MRCRDAQYSFHPEISPGHLREFSMREDWLKLETISWPSGTSFGRRQHWNTRLAPKRHTPRLALTLVIVRVNDQVGRDGIDTALKSAKREGCCYFVCMYVRTYVHRVSYGFRRFSGCVVPRRASSRLGLSGRDFEWSARTPIRQKVAERDGDMQETPRNDEWSVAEKQNPTNEVLCKETYRIASAELSRVAKKSSQPSVGLALLLMMHQKGIPISIGSPDHIHTLFRHCFPRPAARQ